MLWVGSGRAWRIAMLPVGVAAAALMAVVGCAGMTVGTPVPDTVEAPDFRASMSSSVSRSAATASEREAARQQSVTAAAVANACELFSSTSVEGVTAINAYVNAAAGNAADVAVKAQAAVDTLNRGADAVAGAAATALTPQMSDTLTAWADAARAVATAIGQRYGQHQFNVEVDTFNRANRDGLMACGGPP